MKTSIPVPVTGAVPITPRVAAIHDLSGFGRCSLTVALPILSAMGVQCCPVPTAFLSTHTGGFEGFTFLDMTEEIPAITRHWKDLHLHFDAIYSGFLGSQRQIALVMDFIRTFRSPDTIVVVDPVMGDHGVAYQTYTPEMCEGMAQLAEIADVITPNVTEASFLLHLPYDHLPPLEELVTALSLGGKRSVTLTGAELTSDTTGALCYDASMQTLFPAQAERIPRLFHGTGDVFASVLTGGLVQGENLQKAALRAAEFTSACAARTLRENLPVREGVDFEPLLGMLTVPYQNA